MCYLQVFQPNNAIAQQFANNYRLFFTQQLITNENNFLMLILMFGVSVFAQVSTWRSPAGFASDTYYQKG